MNNTITKTNEKINEPKLNRENHPQPRPFLSYHIITYGCQMNKNDSERMAGLLENLGYEMVLDWRQADLVLLNTCSIREKAERRVEGRFFELDHYRRTNNKKMELGIMGCMPQHAKKFILERLPFINYVIGVNNMEDLPNFLGKNINIAQQMSKMRIKRREKDVQKFELNLAHQVRAQESKAWISIQFGCNKVCSFCIVPHTRGREISRKKEDIFKEIESIRGKNDQIVLLGQNVNAYGLTIYPDYDFADLLNDIATHYPWLKKIDFLTSYPNEVTDELIAVIARHDNITKEIHFPLQHGDDEILKKMDRHYTVAEYLERVESLRKCMPQIRLGTDLIVGFPGEEERHFQNMLNTIEKIGFDFANTAAYSRRPGTKAARMPNQVDEKVKLRRLHILNDFLQELYHKKKGQQQQPQHIL